MRTLHSSTRTSNAGRGNYGFLSLCAGLLATLTAPSAGAQYTPIISGAVSFQAATAGGQHNYQPVFTPVVIAPLGPHFLAEARFGFREIVARNSPTDPYTGSFFKSIAFLQLDYIAAPRLTVVAGQFITPFNIFSERLSPVWIQNFANGPIIAAIGTRFTGESDGLMARGVAFANDSVHVDYAGYYSVHSGIPQLSASRSAGDRIDLFFPHRRIEVGTSFNRVLEGVHNNSVGAHFVWLPWSVPLQIHSEYAHSEHAQGYWIEAAYRLSQFGGRESIIGRAEPLFRMQQLFRNSPSPGDALPGVDTKLADFGLDYHFPHEVRLNTSYSRKFASIGNQNSWNISLTYRLLFPAWRGHNR